MANGMDGHDIAYLAATRELAGAAPGAAAVI
jgi:hypothetical protein